MESKYVFKVIPRLIEARCTCRAFSTHLPRHQATPPLSAPPTTTPPPYSSPQYAPNRNPRSNNELLKMAAGWATDEKLRGQYNRVAQFDRKRNSIAEIEKKGRARDLEKQMLRQWKMGDVYAPHDLSSVEMEKWRRRRAGAKDVFDMLGINPLGEYKNFSMMSEYMTSMGRIRHRKDTGLRAVNQRKIAKAIRRAVGMGLIPSVHRHPEVLEMEAKARYFKKWIKDKERGNFGGMI